MRARKGQSRSNTRCLMFALAQKPVVKHKVRLRRRTTGGLPRIRGALVPWIVLTKAPQPQSRRTILATVQNKEENVGRKNRDRALDYLQSVLNYDEGRTRTPLVEHSWLGMLQIIGGNPANRA